jgi:hypothetical protein
MNDLLLQLIIVVAAGAFCFGCGILTACIVTRNKWRREMIRRGAAAEETEGVGSAMIQGAADRGEYSR